MRTLGVVAALVVATVANAGWQRVSGLEAAQLPASIEISATDPNLVFVVGSEGSFWRSSDAGRSWTRQQGEFGAVFSIATDPVVPGVAVLAGSSGAFWKTADSGATWTKIPGNDGWPTVGRIDTDPHNGSILYAVRISGSDAPSVLSALLRSDNGGASWRPIIARSIVDFVVDPFNPSVIYAAYRDYPFAGLARSADGGQTWTYPYANQIYDITLDPRRPDTLYIIVNGISFGYDLRVSHDAGQTWTTVPVSIGGQKASPVHLIVDPINSRTLYASTFFFGVVRSTDGGQSWSTMNEGLPAVEGAGALAIDRDARYLLLAAEKTLFRLELPGPNRRRAAKKP